MKHRIGILLLLVGLFVAAAANPAWACGDGDADHVAQFHEKADAQSCCADNAEPSHCSENADTCDESHPGQACPDEDGCGNCHCPGCGVVSTGGAGGLLMESPALTPVLCDSGSAKRQAFYFAGQIPEAVFLPIWQPPKIGA